jgi:hypothetical protein
MSHRRHGGAAPFLKPRQVITSPRQETRVTDSSRPTVEGPRRACHLSDGTFLLSQTPDDFMDKDRYVPDKILGFLQQWAPKKKA